MNPPRPQPPRGLHGISLGTLRCGRGCADDAGVVIVHASSGQHGSGVGLAEGEESGLTELLQGLVPEAKNG